MYGKHIKDFNHYKGAEVTLDVRNIERIIIFSPTAVATGGTELLQQLCNLLRSFGWNSFMYYCGQYKNSPVEKKFSSYGNPIINTLDDTERDLVIVPETLINLLGKFHNVKKAIWWLSVDNYYGSLKKPYDFLHRVYYYIRNIYNKLFIFNNSLHFVQSRYAYDYLVSSLKVEESKIAELSDYLNDDFFELHLAASKTKKENIILYNPKKGFEFTSRLMDAIPEYRWVALENLSRNEMIKYLSQAKVYVDFGNHPGKDRIPREAAVSGCCIITGKLGAAANDKDVPIPRSFKFDNDISKINEIHKCITECMDNYDNIIKEFVQYNKKIRGEKEEFKSQAKSIFGCKNSKTN